MFKKLFGVSPEPAPAPETETLSYEVPATMPALDPDMEGVLVRMKLPDSIKQYMVPKPVVESTEWGEPMTGEVISDAGDAMSAEVESNVAGALTNAFSESDGQSVPLLINFLKDPRFALISVKFLAFGLSKEAAVLWAAEAASLSYAIRQEQNANAQAMPAMEEKAVEQARAFARGTAFSPKEAELATQEAGFKTPAGLAAQAASWSVEPPPVEASAGEDMIANMINGAVILAAAMTLPDFELDPSVSSNDMSESAEPIEIESAPLIEADPDKAMPMAKALKPFIEKGLAIGATA